MYLVIPFLAPGKSQRLLEKLATVFFLKGRTAVFELQLTRAKF